jgi:hypothetical protein
MHRIHVLVQYRVPKLLLQYQVQVPACIVLLVLSESRVLTFFHMCPPHFSFLFKNSTTTVRLSREKEEEEEDKD